MLFRSHGAHSRSAASDTASVLQHMALTHALLLQVQLQCFRTLLSLTPCCFMCNFSTSEHFSHSRPAASGTASVLQNTDLIHALLLQVQLPCFRTLLSLTICCFMYNFSTSDHFSNSRPAASGTASVLQNTALTHDLLLQVQLQYFRILLSLTPCCFSSTSHHIWAHHFITV